MNWDKLLEVWDEFLWFMDRVMKWLQYVFGVINEWPPEDYPELDEKKTEA